MSNDTMSAPTGQAEQEHAGFAIDLLDERLDNGLVRINAKHCHADYRAADNSLDLTMSLDSAVALRDALNSFLAFHRH